MDEHSLRVLEFDKVIDITAGFAASEPGRDAVRKTRPESGREAAVLRLQETREITSLLHGGEHPPLEGILNISAALGKLGPLGGALTPLELLHIATTLAAGRRVKAFFQRYESRGTVPLACSRVAALRSLKAIEDAISAAVDERAEVRDSASPALRRIRKQLARTREDLLGRMSSILQDAAFQKVIQEPVITIRDDRYVLPLKPNFRQNLKGVVHGHSGSRATLFVEPLEVLDQNNRLAELRLEEREEVERILRELTALVSGEREAIAVTLDTLAAIDAVHARARFGLALDGTVPDLAPGRRLRLRGARHPLLAWKRKNSGVTPNDIELDEDDRALILSGPNAGGKTVVLKTVGLVCLMAQAGLPVPAAEGAELPCFASIFADIGDEQSIEQDLSTFSSRVGTIAAILRQAGSDALVLLDELGSGTDPAEGAGLGAAVLEELIERGCLTLATTHHNGLKLFGAQTKGAVNAAMEFDPDTLKPTYRLIPGRPGRSYGLDMAARIGIPDRVIERARARIGEDDARLESLLKQVELDAERLAAERRTLERELAEARLDRGAAEAALRAAREEAREVRARAQRESRDIVAELRAKLRDLSHAPALDRERQKEASARIGELSRQLASGDEASPLPEPPVDLHPGDRVRIPRWNRPATVVATQRGVLELEVDGKKLKLPAREVMPFEPLRAERSASAAQGWSAELEDEEDSSDRLNIIGMRVHEGLAEVERFLDRAGMQGLSSVTIIHGLGTGALRAAVTEYLSRQPLVTALRQGESAEGGAGVTVATMKK